jgi:hypothetical protein
VDDVEGRQTIPAGEPGLPWRTTAQSTPFAKKLRLRNPMDRPVDSTAAEQQGVCRMTIAIASTYKRVMSSEDKRMRAAISGKRSWSNGSNV